MNTDVSEPILDRPDPKKIGVLIVDDHAVVRQGLRTFLELQDDPSALPIEVVGEAANGVEAVDLARRLQPDVVLLDLVMPGMDGIQATPRIIENSPHSRVIILTSFGEEDKVVPAIRAGAQGYLLKDIPPNDLVRAVRAAYLGQVQLHPEVARKLMSAVAAQGEPPVSQPAAPFAELTEREVEVLRLIAGGLNNREIADRLVISDKTVKTHVSSILGKLHLGDRTQAAIYALRHGLAPDGD
jgi:NarL family two-component system response regulator LiaR